MSYVRFKLARAAEDLATSAELTPAIWPELIDQRVEKVFGRHVYGLEARISPEDEELRAPLEALIDRWTKIKQKRSTYRSRMRAMSIATELCNIAAQFPPPRA